MPITVTEKFDSRQSTMSSSARVEFGYTVSGTDDDIAAKTALVNATPLTYDNLLRQEVRIEPLGPGLWDGKVVYGLPEKNERPQTGDCQFSFDTGGGTQHITQSIANLRKVPAKNGAVPDFGGAINVTHDSVEGVDITVPKFEFSETNYLPDWEVTLAYRLAVCELTGTVNLAGFRGFEPGEVLFLGASGTRRGLAGNDWEISYRFAVSRNVANFCADWPADVKPDAPVPKGGWDYAWMRYVDHIDDAECVATKKPAGIYIEKVYQSGDFSRLLIGN